MADLKLIHALEEDGLSRREAEVIANALDYGHTQRNSPWMVACGLLLVVVVVGGFGLSAAELSAIDSRHHALDQNLTALERKVDSNAERLTRIETLIMERLPAPE